MNGTFLSLDSLEKLLSDETEITITDELIKFIVDLLNFQQQFSITAKGSTGKVPD